jgi:hypothetical protein
MCKRNKICFFLIDLRDYTDVAAPILSFSFWTLERVKGLCLRSLGLGSGCQ